VVGLTTSRGASGPGPAGRGAAAPGPAESSRGASAPGPAGRGAAAPGTARWFFGPRSRAVAADPRIFGPGRGMQEQGVGFVADSGYSRTENIRVSAPSRGSRHDDTIDASVTEPEIILTLLQSRRDAATQLM